MNTLADIALDAIIIPPDRRVRALAPGAAADAELALSIRTQGVVWPLLLRRQGNQLALVKGARRMKAARAAGLETVPARIFAEDDPRTDAELVAASTIRAAINPVDRWLALKAMMEGGASLERAADTLGMSPRLARQAQRLGSLIPEILDAIAQGAQHGFGPTEAEQAKLASADAERQRAAWKTHGKAILATAGHGYRPPWWDLASACHVVRMAATDARFDAEAAARHGIVWEEDLFAPADTDSRHTTDVAAFRRAQLEWMEEQVRGLLAQGYQAEVRPMEKPGDQAIPKGMELVQGKPEKAPKRVTRGYYVDSAGRVNLVLYQRPRAPEAKKGKAGAAEAPAGDDDDDAPAPPKPAEPRGISKKGLALIAEQKEIALDAALDELLTLQSGTASTTRTAQMLHALLIALTGENVTVRTGRFSTADLRENLAELLRPDGTPAEVSIDMLIGAAHDALSAMLLAPRPEWNGAGLAFDRACAVLGTQAPRCDFAEILAELPKAVLTSLATQHGEPAKAGAKELARQLAGKLDRWRPVEAEFRPAPLAAGEEDAGGEEAEEAA
jgi:ParB/RepB/Spo0J family partition protein